MRRPKFARLVELTIPCTSCSLSHRKDLSWLIGLEKMPCSHCGRVIDLENGIHAVLIQELAKACARADQTLGSPQKPQRQDGGAAPEDAG